MLQAYLQEKGISIYRLAKMSGCAYSTLNDLVNGKVSVDHISAGLLKQLAGVLGISMDEAYRICGSEMIVRGTDEETVIRVLVKNKTYFARFSYQGVQEEIPLYPVNKITSFYIDEIAGWRVEDYISGKKEEALWNILSCEETIQ